MVAMMGTAVSPTSTPERRAANGATRDARARRWPAGRRVKARREAARCTAPQHLELQSVTSSEMRQGRQSDSAAVTLRFSRRLIRDGRYWNIDNGMSNNRWNQRPRPGDRRFRDPRFMRLHAPEVAIRPELRPTFTGPLNEECVNTPRVLQRRYGPNSPGSTSDSRAWMG
jgi:hypothetical protein